MVHRLLFHLAESESRLWNTRSFSRIGCFTCLLILFVPFAAQETGFVEVLLEEAANPCSTHCVLRFTICKALCIALALLKSQHCLQCLYVVLIEVAAGTSEAPSDFVTRQLVHLRRPNSGISSRAKTSSNLFCFVFSFSDPLRCPGLFRSLGIRGFKSLGYGMISPFASRFRLPPILGSREYDDDGSYRDSLT